MREIKEINKPIIKKENHSLILIVDAQNKRDKEKISLVFFYLSYVI